MKRATPKYTKWRREMIKKGLWGDQFVDPTETREYIEMLLKNGLSTNDIANASGVTYNTVDDIRFQRVKKIWAVTAEAIQEVKSYELVPGLVPAYRAQRRLEALIALGYSLRVVGDAINVKPESLSMILSGKRDHVTREVFIGIASYYDGHTKPREPVTSYDKRSVTQCLRMAQERGYVTHWGWDNIDNKSERRKGVQHGRRLSEIEGREDQA